MNYVNNSTKVCIICPEHGEFWQTPYLHTKGHACPICGNENAREKNTSTKEEFIKNARSKHGDKYDYSNVEYVNDRTKVCIKCPKHGEFYQRPNSHLSGHGCSKCKGDKTREMQTLTKEGFIKRANDVHESKYNYDKVKYVDAKTKVCIICSKHNEFWQRPTDHIKGQGCPKCKGDKLRERQTSTKEEWITSANKKHGDKYNYDKVEYVNSATKVCIICPEHDEFYQTPNDHLSGRGCPKCNLSHLERSMMIYLDENGITYDYQKRFDWLGLQSLDFYLPDYNVGIECQGEQHFFPIKHFGDDKSFKKTLERDKRKKALCEKYGVKLLYFGNVPNYDTFLGETVHDDVQYLIDYLNEHKINGN